ncbi:MAG: thioredoxin family protein [Desulfitobacteriaceae bacterium]|jgi:thiol-disulfide isomerase/thioredoxin|nr:thioredoxin family protein [Desulfitobacteriaceae bacterium]MDD4753200.1 thioredoxin family protein [Desulfitobacteriaceae bacterium]
MEPVISALEERFRDQVRFITIDVEESDNLSIGKIVEMYQVNYIPAYFFIDQKGNTIDHDAGPIDEDDLTEKIAKLTK